MNAIMTLKVYKHGAAWVFDDAFRKLDKEPFVAGMDDIIDTMVEKIPYAALGFNLFFAAAPFPGHTCKLVATGEDFGGVWYKCVGGPADGMTGWLCPALFKFFRQAPPTIYIKVKGEVMGGA